MRPSLHTSCLLTLSLLVFLACGLTQSSNAPQNKEPVAIVSGQAIYEDDLLPHIQADIRRLRHQEFQVKNRALQNLILERLWQAEAQKRGLTPEKLLELEADAKVPEPTDAEVESQYQQQKDRLKRPFEEVKAEIRQSLKQAKVHQARRDYFQRLWDAGNISILLQPPKTQVAHDRARVRGNPNAPVVIVEFSDFQCPFCRRVQPTLMALLAKYQGQVNVAYRDFPLREIHPQAQMAAEASRCAGEQGKFWEYHDLLFAPQSTLARPALEAHAQTLALETKRFATCLDTGKYKPAVEEDLQAGIRAGVGGTPGFFINGAFLDGAQPQAEFEKIIDAELTALKKK